MVAVVEFIASEARIAAVELEFPAMPSVIIIVLLGIEFPPVLLLLGRL